MATDQNNFEQPSAGAADWDSSLNGNFGILESGFRAKGQAGEDINTGDILTVGSDGFSLRFDPNSEDIKPHLLSLTALSSGDEANFVAFGSVRSLGVWGGVIPGHEVFVSVLTPGMPVSSYSGANRGVGFAHYEDGFVFQPGASHFPEIIEDVTSIDTVNGSLHLFQMDFGRAGWNRRVHMVGDSGDLTELKLYANSSRNDAGLLFSTISGGVTVIGSHLDQAGFPYFNTDPSTYSGLIYGSIKTMSASVASDSIGITITMERFR
jgi:hypothetical protein